MQSSFIRRAVPRAMVALSFIRANVLKRRRSLVGRRLVSSSRRPRVVSDKSPRAGIGDVDFFFAICYYFGYFPICKPITPLRCVVDRGAMERGDLFPGMISREIDVPYVKLISP